MIVPTLAVGETAFCMVVGDNVLLERPTCLKFHECSVMQPRLTTVFWELQTRRAGGVWVAADMSGSDDF